MSKAPWYQSPEKYKEEAKRKIIQALKSRKKPFLTLKDLAESAGISWITARDYCQELIDEGKIKCIVMGKSPRILLFFLPDDIKERPELLKEILSGVSHTNGL